MMNRACACCFALAMLVLVVPGFPATIGVNVTNFSFTPSTITLATLDTVIWTRITGTHNVHHNVAVPKFHNDIGNTWTTYVWPCSVGVGVLPYVCQVHPGSMQGTVNVASITVTSPNGGDQWIVGNLRTITWTSTNLSASANVIIELNRNYPAGGWETITASTVNDGSHSFTVGGSASSNVRIRIRTVATSAITGSISDLSDADFEIIEPSITVLTPNGGEVWIEDEVREITWTSVGVSGSVNIEINRAFPGGAWQNVVSNTANDGTHDWTVTFPGSTACRVRIYRSSMSSISDTSDANFTIIQPLITITYPNGGEQFVPGDSVNITWTYSAVPNLFDVHFNRTYPSGTWELLYAATTQELDHPWIVTGPVSSTCRIRVRNTNQASRFDYSNSNFSIVNPFIVLDRPDGGESWTAGTADTVEWHSTGGIPDVIIELDRNFPSGLWETLVASTPNDTIEFVNVTGPATTQARLRISSVTDSTVMDTSDSEFTIIVNESLTLVSPNGGEVFYVGNQATVDWLSTGSISDVRVLLDRDYPSGTFDTLLASTTNDGTESFAVTAPVSTLCRLRIESLVDAGTADESDADFEIRQILPPVGVVANSSYPDVLLWWYSVADADSYVVYRSTDPLADPFLEWVVTTAETTAVDPGAANAFDKYFYIVRSMKI